jgi:hypothetical protein
MKKLLAATGLALIALSTTIMAGEDEGQVGKKIYERAFSRGCGTCHDVAPTPNLVKEINEGTLDEKKFADVMKNGKGNMVKAIDTIMALDPVKKAGLSEDQAIDVLYKYLKGKK